MTLPRERSGASETRVTGEVTDVRAAHRFDEDELARWLEGRLEGAERGLSVRQFEGGQSNPTFLLETDRGRWVLRKKPASSAPSRAPAFPCPKSRSSVTTSPSSGRRSS